jgi:hypothetical protein
MFYHVCSKEYCPRNIYLGYYVFVNGDSYSRLANDIDIYFRVILVWVFLPMVINYFNGYAH